MSKQERPVGLARYAADGCTIVLSYEAWLSAVASVLAGHGFTNVRAHLDTIGDYTRAAYELGMTYVRCANNVAKAHAEGRTLGGA